MRLVYADEAGISNRNQEPWAVVASVIVHADQKLNAVERHLDRLVERHIPEKNRNGFVFHATELFNGGGKTFERHNSEWPLERRLTIADDLAAIPKRFALPIAFGWIERAAFLENFPFFSKLSDKERNIAEHVSAYMTCAMLVEHWIRQNASDEICLMVVEDNDRARRRILEQHRYHQQRGIFELLHPSAQPFFPFRKIKEDPLFQPKRSSSVLQLADFCAYVFKRFLMGDRHYDRFVEPIWPYVTSYDEEALTKKRQHV